MYLRERGGGGGKGEGGGEGEEEGEGEGEGEGEEEGKGEGGGGGEEERGRGKGTVIKKQSPMEHEASPEGTSLLLCPDDLHHSEELLVALVPLLFLQH